MAPKINAEVPPGHELHPAITASPFLTQLAEHTGVLRCIDDHSLLWAQAETADERLFIHERFRRQLARTFVSFGGFELYVHGAESLVIGNFEAASVLFFVGALILYLAKGGK